MSGPGSPTVGASVLLGGYGDAGKLLGHLVTNVQMKTADT